MSKVFEPWIGVDLDGTLAYYSEWKGMTHIGLPIDAMVKKVKAILETGICVKIFTARVCEGPEAVAYIKQWLKMVGFPDLEVTNVKDFGMVELWDDRCRRVVANKGVFSEK